MHIYTDHQEDDTLTHVEIRWAVEVRCVSALTRSTQSTLLLVTLWKRYFQLELTKIAQKQIKYQRIEQKRDEPDDDACFTSIIIRFFCVLCVDLTWQRKCSTSVPYTTSRAQPSRSSSLYTSIARGRFVFVCWACILLGCYYQSIEHIVGTSGTQRNAVPNNECGFMELYI